MANAYPTAVQSWHEPTNIWLVPKSEETTPWETLHKHWRDGWWGEPSNQTHHKRRRPDRNTSLAQTLDRCDKTQWRLRWRPVNVFCEINSFLKEKKYSVQNFWNDSIFIRNDLSSPLKSEMCSADGANLGNGNSMLSVYCQYAVSILSV